jgi:NAD+ kinase
MDRIGILFRPREPGAYELARTLEDDLRARDVEVWSGEAWDDLTPSLIEGTDLLFCLGGDGTILRAARVAAPHPVLIVGVNLGRLGFLTELEPEALWPNLDRILSGEARVEERTMVQATLYNDGLVAGPFHGLNDVVVSRYAPGRPVYVTVLVDTNRLGVYRCDSMVIATPTGSTGYSMSAGGPILHPASHHLVMTPVAAHLAMARSLVLPVGASVTLAVDTDHRAVLSVDGQLDLEVGSGSRVEVATSPHRTRFLKLSPPSDFYPQLARRLDPSSDGT